MSEGILPSSWALATIDDLVGIHGVFRDGDWVESKDQNQNGQVRLIQLADIGDGEFKDKSSRFLTPEKAVELNCTFLENGDVLVARMPDPLGRACLFPLQGNKKFVTVVDVCVIRFGHNLVDVRYFMYALNSPASRKNISDHQTGSTRKRISRGNLSTVQFSIAPLPEQHRIVAKIEELFSELDKGVEYLKTVQAQLKVYRQALLKHAFEGKLTAVWREQNRDKLETAAALQQRIQQERTQRYQQQLADWEQRKSPSVPLLQRGKTTSATTTILSFEEGGLGKISEHPPLKKGGRGDLKPKPPKLLPPLTKEELTELPELPEGWKWLKSGELFESVTSGSRGWAEYYADSGAIFIRIANLDFNSLKLDLNPKKIQYVQPPVGAEGLRTKVKEGDFLFSITGYLGMFAIAPSLDDAYVNQHVSLARPLDGFSKKYFGYYVTSHTGGIHYLNKQTKGAVKAGLGLDDIQNFPVPICSLNEQIQISGELESRLSETDQLDQTITTALQQAESLRQSILKKAFSGQLVPQDPNDEPASELLARIKAERGGSAPRSKRKTT